MRHGDLECAEHRGSHDEHQQCEKDQHGRKLQPRAEETAGERREHSQRRVGDGQAEDIHARESDPLTAASLRLRAEVADRDRDQRIHARGQIERQPQHEDGQKSQWQAMRH